MFPLGFHTRPTEYDAAPGTSVASRNADAARVFPLHHSARLTDLLVSLLLIGRVAVPGLPTGSFDQLGLFILVLLAIFRRPVRAVPVWYPAAALGLMAFLVFESAVNGVEPGAFIQRSLNISLSLVTAGFMASGRIDVASVVKGIGIALALNTVLFYAGIAPHPYGSFLTGYLGDKNVSGLFFATMPLLIAVAMPRWWQRIAVVVLGGGALWLTGSRTSMAAYVAALVWIAVSAKGNWLVKVGVGAGLYAAFTYASDNLANIGRFSAREGSDEFRAQIDAATFAKVDATPWYGKGLSEATVTLPNDGGTWFFHNSFAALWVEGGIVMTVVVLGLYGGSMVALSLRTAGRWRAGAAVGGGAGEKAMSLDGGVAPGVHGAGERARPALRVDRLAVAGAIGAVLLCATRLGEVFVAQIGFIVLGAALALLLETRRFEASEWVPARRRDRDEE